MSTSPPGTLHTACYTDPTIAATIARLMGDEQTLLLDVRLSPRSRWYPAWNRSALAATYGLRYRWDKRLGNLNYRDRTRGIALAEGHLDAAQEAATLLSEGNSIILVCACKDARTCHRTIVATLIQDVAQAPVGMQA